MLTRDEILSSYKEVDFPEKLIDKSISNKNKNIIFYNKSSKPCSEKAKFVKKLSESYVIPRHLLIQKNSQGNQGFKTEFSRSSNFTPKEALVDIKIDNFKLIYDKFNIPVETNLIYMKNTYGGVNGPYNLEQLKNLYKNKKIDSNNDFRTIDIFSFKDTDSFSFQSLKIINDEKWIDLVVDNSLINYCDLFKIKKVEKTETIEEKEEKNEKEEENTKKEEKKVPETEGNWEVASKKKKKVKSKEIKETKEKEVKEVKEEKEENKNIKKEEEAKDSLEALDMKIQKEKKENNDDLLEILRKKKMEKEKQKLKEEEQKEENIKEDVKEVKKEEPRSKKGKKKKKKEFEETEIDLGFLVK